MPTNIIGSIAANDLVAIGSHPAGDLAFGPFNVPAGYTEIMVVYDLRQVAALTATLGASLDISFNSGTNWESAGSSGLSLPNSGYVLDAGVLRRSASDPSGPNAPVRIFGKRFTLRQAHLTTRQIRGVLSLSEALITGVTLVGF